MGHIEPAGIHPGDPACVILPINPAPRHIETPGESTRRIAVELGVAGVPPPQHGGQRRPPPRGDS